MNYIKLPLFVLLICIPSIRIEAKNYNSPICLKEMNAEQAKNISLILEIFRSTVFKQVKYDVLETEESPKIDANKNTTAEKYPLSLVETSSKNQTENSQTLQHALENLMDFWAPEFLPKELDYSTLYSHIPYEREPTLEEQTLQNETYQKAKKKFKKLMSDFFIEQFPNGGEIHTLSSSMAFWDTLLEKFIKDLKEMPSAGAVVRDVLKIQAVYSCMANGLTVGGSKYHYGADHLYSQVLKAGSKLIQISILMQYFGFSKESASVLSNYMSDAFSRAIIIAGEEWQDQELAKSNSNSTTTPEHFESFFIENFDSGWFQRGIFQSIPKGILADAISGSIKYLCLVPKIREKTFPIVSYPFKILLGIAQKSNVFWFQNAKNNIDSQTSFLKKPLYWAGAFISTCTTYYAVNTAVTVIMVPLCKPIVNIPKLASKFTTEPVF